MPYMVGKQSLSFDYPPHIIGAASVVGLKENEGPLGGNFDEVVADPMCGGENWEDAESRFQKKAAELAIKKANINKNDIRYIFAGDLLGQLVGTTFGIIDLEIPMFGLFGACSTMGESMALGAMAVSADYATNVLALTSSHFCGAEKQFRFPLEYGNQRPLSASWTVTGSGAVVLGKSGGDVCVRGTTTGKMMDYGIKDSMNMGASMAPAAFDVISNNLIDFNVGPDYYDKIITGDLGKIGGQILKDLLLEKNYDIADRYLDCGDLIFDSNAQDTHAGGSGCGCSAVVLCAHILDKMKRKEWNRVLFVPTGALLSPVSFNEGRTVPSVAHGIVLETVNN